MNGRGKAERAVDVSGQVLEADVRSRRFQLWLDETTSVTVTYPPEQEAKVLCALRDHRVRHLRVVGRGRYNAHGKLLRVNPADKLELLPAATPPEQAPPSIEDVLARLASEVPAEDWQRLPGDLTDQIDHYVYGTPKR